MFGVTVLFLYFKCLFPLYLLFLYSKISYLIYIKVNLVLKAPKSKESGEVGMLQGHAFPLSRLFTLISMGKLFSLYAFLA